MKKLLSILRWVLVMLVNLLGYLTAKVVYPLAYLLRNVDLFRNKLLWWFYDDEIPEAWHYQNWLKGRKETFWRMYQWHTLRNPAWNLQASLKPKQGLKNYVSSKGWHKEDGNYDISVFKLCVLKYVDKNGEYDDLTGDYLSLRYSIIGKMFVWYTIDNTLYWRYSVAKKLFKKIWWELQLGTNDRRYTFRLKIKKVKIYEAID